MSHLTELFLYTRNIVAIVLRSAESVFRAGVFQGLAIRLRLLFSIILLFADAGV